MDRRQFLISNSVLTASMVMPNISLAKADTSDIAPNTTRLSLADINKLGIKAPFTHAVSPNNDIVSFALKMRIARRYQDLIFIWFDTENMIRIYDEFGTQSNAIPLPKHISSLKDFAFDSMGNLFVLPQGQHHILWLSEQGYELGYIGEFGIELSEQLNGPVSLTIDLNDQIHVLNAGTRTIKVFSNNGVFLFEYGQNRRGKQKQIHSIDGKKNIILKGGMMKDRTWQLSPKGKLLVTH